VKTFIFPAGKRQEAGRKMLAVLPFENLGAAGDEYFADGITDEISARLGSISGLGVISRTSAMQYKKSSKSLPTIARELGVQYILEGTIRWEKAGGSSRVRIIPRLIREPEDVQLWADNIDRVLQDIFAIQSDIAGRVVASLDIALLGSEKRSLASVPTRNLEAHDLYLQGRFYWNKRTPQDLTTAVKLFEQAIAKDSTYALAYAGLADCYVLLPDYAGVGREYYAKAEATALKALSLDASLAEAHAALGQEKYDNWDWTGAEKEYRRAIELDPNYATAHHWYANYLASMKRFEEAMREIKRAHELDPVSRAIMAGWADIARCSRDYDQAIAQCRAALEMDPTFGNAHWILGSVYEQQGRHDEAVSEWLETVTASWNYESQDQLELHRAYSVGGWKAFYREVVRLADAKWRQHVLWTGDGASACMALGDYDAAFKWLDRMYEQHDSELILINVDPLYDPIRTDKRFVALLKKVGLEK
jgi:TolB-like protein/Tfp pilus assembly protein PilF